MAHTSKPAVLRFSARVEGDVVMIPAAVSRQLRGMPKVEGTVNGHPFRARVTPCGDEYELHINQSMHRRASQTGESEFALLGPEPDPVPPADLQTEFDQSPEAVENWRKLTTLGQRDWLRWIDDTNKPETRARRIARTIEQLSEGKRRACCVDVNGFMMCRIREDEADGSSRPIDKSALL